MSKIIKKVAAVVAVVAAVVLTGGTALLATIGKALVTAAVSIGVSRLIAKRANTPADAGGDAGGRIQLPPATTNKLPVVYGTAFIGGSITDAMLSVDQKTMWYVVALAEHSDDQGAGAGAYTYDTTKCYYDGKLIQFGTNGAVTGLYTNNANPSSPSAQLDTRCNGFLYVYLFTDGSSSGVNTGGLTAAQILSNANGVPVGKEWGPNQLMSNCAFAIVKVIYSSDAGTTGAGQLMVNITNSITKPGDAILDYMLNTRYGCGLPITSIDTASLVDLNTYSDDLIDYKPVGWNTGDPYQQQARYRINGPVDTSFNCLNNLQFLVDSCDSWLQYSELTGKWRVVMNKGYDQAPNAKTLNQLFGVTSSNLIGGIEISPIDLNETYNQIEVAYPNTNIKDQVDYQVIDLWETDPTILNTNEAVNRLNITLPLVNNAVQAKYLAARRIYQSREDLVIAFRLDFSGIQVEAGDVIRVTHEVYGWTDKLFRVATVAETKDEGGNLYADIQAFEYNNDIFDDIIQDFVPAFNTGLKDPNVIDQPDAPFFAPYNDIDSTVSGFGVIGTVPENGLVLYMDFNYGFTSNVLEHRRYKTINQSNGVPFTNSDYANSYYNDVLLTVNDLPAANYYWSVTARNDFSGRRSNSSIAFDWQGANIIPPNPSTLCNVSSNGNVITSDPFGTLKVGSTIQKISGNGTLDVNTYITNVTSNTTFTISSTPIVALSNACIGIQTGGIIGNQIQNGSITINNFSSNLSIQERISGNNFSINEGNPLANLSAPLLPVDATANTLRNIPVYFTGVNVGTNFYPYSIGTSNVSAGTNGNNYYAQNSTGSWTPKNASVLLAGDSDDNWWAVCQDSFPTNSLSNGQSYFMNGAFTAVSDTDGTVLQIVQGFTTGNLTYWQSDTNRMDTLEMNYSYNQYSWERVQVENVSGATNVTGGAVLVRCITPGANVIITSGSFQSLKGIPPFF